MNFKEWLSLQEVGTGTSSIAAFARPVFPTQIKRKPVENIVFKKKVN